MPTGGTSTALWEIDNAVPYPTGNGARVRVLRRKLFGREAKRQVFVLFPLFPAAFV